jgi:methyl-accepting chemotaxis protein
MLSNLKIKNKLIVLLILPTLLLIALSLNLLLSTYNEKEELSHLEKSVTLATKIGKLVHETQKERGFTAGFIGSKGNTFQDELSNQRNSTDLKITELKKYLKSYLDITPVLQQQINTSFNFLNKIENNRNNITSLSIGDKEAISYYTNMNKSLLNIVSIIAHESHDIEILKEIVAYEYF